MEDSAGNKNDNEGMRDGQSIFILEREGRERERERGLQDVGCKDLGVAGRIICRFGGRGLESSK
jgi:hypothetical protein